MKNIIFFDGYCNLCNNSIDLIIRFDKDQKFYFAPLSGETAKEYKLEIPRDESEQSVIFVNEEGKIYYRSDAAIEIACVLFKPSKVLFLIPRFFRDHFYKLIATNRYSLFGKKDTCRLPTAEERARFLS